VSGKEMKRSNFLSKNKNILFLNSLIIASDLDG